METSQDPQKSIVIIWEEEDSPQHLQDWDKTEKYIFFLCRQRIIETDSPLGEKNSKNKDDDKDDKDNNCDDIDDSEDDHDDNDIWF